MDTDVRGGCEVLHVGVEHDKMRACRQGCTAQDGSTFAETGRVPLHDESPSLIALRRSGVRSLLPSSTTISSRAVVIRSCVRPGV
jgi:hypothetical protein